MNVPQAPTPPPALHTARLWLRPFTPDDAAFIVELLNTEGWLRFIGDRDVRTPDDARRYLREGPMAMQAARGFSLWAVLPRDGAVPIGMCGLIRRETLDDVDLGYAFLPAHHGRGYAREAAAAMLAHGFERLGLRRIVAIMDPANAASARVVQALGMRYEGLIRIAGSDRDSALYGITRP